MPRIYISHRPVDSSRNEVRLIKEHLIAEFGADNIISTTDDHMDTTLGRQAMVESCDVLLVVIGQYWLDMVDERGNNLLEDPYDRVHVELSAGKDSEKMIRVLLVDDANKPAFRDLPEVLRWLARQNTATASTDDQLTDYIDSFIEQVQSLPEQTEQPTRSHPMHREPLVTATEQQPTREEAQRVLASNPPYVPPSSRSTTPDTSSNEQSQTSAWGMAILIGAIFLGFMSAVWEDNASSNRPVPVQIATTAVQVEPTVVPEANKPPHLEFVRHYHTTGDKVGISILDDASLYYEHNNDIYVIDMDTDSLTPIEVYGDSLVFENLIRPEPELLLTQSNIDSIEEQLNDKVLFAWFDGDDLVYFVVLTDRPRIALVSGQEIFASRRILDPINNILIPNQTVVYDPTHNLLMLLANDKEIMTWVIDDEPELLGQHDIAHDTFSLNSVVRLIISPSGDYLIAVGGNGFSLYRIMNPSLSD